MTPENYKYNGYDFTIILDLAINHRDVYPDPPKDVRFCAVFFRPHKVVKYGKHFLIAEELLSEATWRDVVCDMLLDKWNRSLGW